MPAEHTVSVGDRTLAAVHHQSDGDRWLLFCHGFRSDKHGSYESRCARAVEAGYDAVRFDFTGCGESDGTFIESTLSTRIADLRAIIEYFSPSSYALFGSSFGAKVAFHTAPETSRLSALVARAPVTYNRAFQSYRESVEDEGVFRYDPDHAIDGRFFADLDGYEFDTVTGRIDVPVAIFHGTADASVSVADSVRATAELETDVLFGKYADEGHRFSEAAEERLRKQTFDWLEIVH